MITDYDIWVRYNSLTEEDCERIRSHIPKMTCKPLFSIIVPVYNVEERWLRKCIDSVLNQLYPYWELCIADDASTKPHIKKVLKEYADKDPRIKLVFREKNGNISAASNSALDLVSGDFLALLDHDDELTPDALYENAVLLNQHSQADMIYSDEDKIDVEGKRHSPYFKPDWSPDMFMSQNYPCHLSVFRKEIVRKIGGFREGYEGSQDYDLILRFTELSNNIFHIPKILYHWRTIPESTASNQKAKWYAYIAAFKAIQEALDRRKEGGWVESLPNHPGRYVVHYRPKGAPLISIIIPIRDMADLLDKCLKSIFGITTYQNFEIIIIDNGSTEPETFRLLSQWSIREPDRLKIIQLNIPYNWAKINNEAVKYAGGQLVLFLNNDMETISPNWLEEMAGQALRKSIGAVGAFLLYPDQTIQHAGAILGIGCCSHGHRRLHKDAPGYFGRLCGVSNYSAVTGACLMVEKDKYAMVGGFGQEFARDFNDVDFCLKLYEKGFYNVVLPQVKLIHYESKTRGNLDTEEKQITHRNEIRIMMNRWGKYIRSDPFYNRALTLDNTDFSISIKLHKPVKLNQIAGTIIEKSQFGNLGTLNLVRIDHNQIIAEGWAINSIMRKQAEEVLIVEQNKNIIANVKVNTPRPNVTKAFWGKRMLYAGWSANINKNLLQQGDHIIRAYLYLEEEKKAIRLDGEINIVVITQPVELEKYADKVIDNPLDTTGYLDVVRLEHIPEGVFCSGWGRNPGTGAPPEEIFIVNNNKKIVAQAMVTNERHDVAKALNDEGMLRCGWHVRFEKNLLGRGRHTLLAYLYLRKSRVAIRLRQEIKIDII